VLGPAVVDVPVALVLLSCLPRCCCAGAALAPPTAAVPGAATVPHPPPPVAEGAGDGKRAPTLPDGRVVRLGKWPDICMGRYLYGPLPARSFPGKN
jgi:hypothetical protein